MSVYLSSGVFLSEVCAKLVIELGTSKNPAVGAPRLFQANLYATSLICGL